MNITGVDYPERAERFEVIYELFNTEDFSRLRVKTKTSEDKPVPSVISVWKGADWFEREVYDMYGVKFEGHPNLRRILTHHEFVGHPLRKDYAADLQQPCTTARCISIKALSPEKRTTDSAQYRSIAPGHSRNIANRELNGITARAWRSVISIAVSKKWRKLIRTTAIPYTDA